MDLPGPSTAQDSGKSASHVTIERQSTAHVTIERQSTDHVTIERQLTAHVICQIERTDCRTVLDLYRCLVGSCLEQHFNVVYLPTTGNSDNGENVVCLEVQDRITSTSLGSLKLFIIGARIVGHLRMDDGLLITWSRDLAQYIRFDVPIGPRSFRDLQSELLDFQTELVSKTVLHMKSQGGIINLPMLSRMPDNVIDNIFSFLSGSDLREMSFVCRRFKNIAYSDDLWRGVCKKHSWFSRLQQKDRLNGAWRAYYRQYRKFRNRRHRLRRELLEAGARAPTQPIIMINRRRGRRRGEDPQQPIMVIDRRRHRRHGAGGVAPNIRLNRGLRRGAAAANPPGAGAGAGGGAGPGPGPGPGAGAAPGGQQRVGPVRRVFARINPNRRLQIAVRRQQGRAQPVPNPQQPVQNPQQPVQNPQQPVQNPQQPAANPQPAVLYPLPVVPNPQQPVLNPQPAVLYPLPVVPNPQRPVLNPQPAVLYPLPVVPNRQQPVLNPQPAVLYPRPVGPNPQQPVLNPQQAVMHLQPTLVNPQPAVTGRAGPAANAQGPAEVIHNERAPPVQGEAVPRPGDIRGRSDRSSLGEAIGRGRALLEQQRRMIADDMARWRGTARQQQLLSVSRRFEQTLQSASDLFNLIESAPAVGANQIVSDQGLVEQRLVELQRLSQQFHQQAQRPPEPTVPQVPAPVPAPPTPAYAHAPASVPAPSPSAPTPAPSSCPVPAPEHVPVLNPGHAQNPQPQNTIPAAGNLQAGPVDQPNPLREAQPQPLPEPQPQLQPPAARDAEHPAAQNAGPAGDLPEVGQPIPVLAPFPDPPIEGELADDQIQFQMDGQNGIQDENFRINLNAEPLENDLMEDPANQVLRAVRMDDGNVHINAGGVNIAIELPFRGDRAEPPQRVGANNQRERVRLRGRLSHRNENSPFYQLDPRNIQIMRARIAIIGSEFVKRIKCNLSGEFPPNHNFLTLELVYISNMIAKHIRESLDVNSDDPASSPAPPPLPQFYPYFDPEMPGQEVLEGRVNAIAEIFNETLRNSLRSDKVFVNRKVRGFLHNTRDNNVHPPSDNLSLASQYFHRKVRELVSGSALQLENVVVSEGEQTSEHRLTHRVLSVALGRPYEEINRRVLNNVNREQEQRRSVSVDVSLAQHSAESRSDVNSAENRSDVNSAENGSDVNSAENGSDVNSAENRSDLLSHDDGERPGPSRDYNEEQVTVRETEVSTDNHEKPVSSDSKRHHSSETESRDSKSAKLR